jgi:hypothetical protein
MLGGWVKSCGLYGTWWNWWWYMVSKKPETHREWTSNDDLSPKHRVLSSQSYDLVPKCPNIHDLRTSSTKGWWLAHHCDDARLFGGAKLPWATTPCAEGIEAASARWQQNCVPDMKTRKSFRSLATANSIINHFNQTWHYLTAAIL